MPTNGLLTEVRWEWYGTELSADEAAGQTTLSVMNASTLALNQDIWVGTSGPYTITSIDFDLDTIVVTPAIDATFDAGTEVVPDVGGQPGQLWIAEIILPDAEEPVEVPLTVTNLLSMPEGVYDPPLAILLSDDLEDVIDLPGSLPRVETTYVPGVPTPDDGSIPNPPTSVTASQSLYMDPSGQNHVLATVTWSNPIENTDSSPLVDHVENQIERKIGTDNWQPVGRVDASVSAISGGVLPQDVSVTFRVRAVDAFRNYSAWAESSPITTDTDAGTPGIPSTPTVTAPLSTLKIVWDGLLAGGGALPVDYLLTEIHVSTTSDFTPVTGTQVGTMRGKGTFLLNGITPGTPYYVKLVNVDQTGNKSGGSAQGSASATPTQLLGAEIVDNAITAAKIQDSAVTTAKINPEAVTTEKLSVAGFTEQLLANGGMEELSSADATKPARWALSQISATATWATNTANENSGDRCVGLTLSSSTAAGRIYNTRPIPVTPGEVFYISVAVKNSRAAPNTNIVEAWGGTSATDVQNPVHAGTTVTTVLAAETGHTGYTIREGTYTVPAGKTWMTVAIRANAPGDGSGQTMYVDDVIVRKLIGDALIVNLTASKITAGTLTADILMAGSFYTDVSPNPRVEIDGLGIRAYDETDNQTIGISSLDGHGTFEGIEILGESNFGTSDPTTGESGAQISPNGDASFKQLYADDLYLSSLQSQSLYTFISEIGQGVIARSTKTLAANRTATGANAEEDLYEISAECVAGRVYRVSVDPVLISMNAGTESGGFRLRWTTNGTRPTAASAIFGGSFVRAAADADNQDVSVDFQKSFVASTTGVHRWLVQLAHTAPGAADYSRIASGREIRVIVEDLGTEPPDTGINPGDSEAMTSTFTYPFNWTAYYDYATGALLGTGRYYARSRSSTNIYKYGLLGFDGLTQADILSDLTGYTINYVRLYQYVESVLYSFAVYSSEPYQPYHSKASVRVNTHALTTTIAPATGPVAPSVASPIFSGLETWKSGTMVYKDMPLTFGENLRDGTAKGVMFTVPDVSSYDSPSAYIEEWSAWGAGHASKYPYLVINATKY